MHERHSESYLPRATTLAQPSTGARRAFQLAETVSWALMILGLAAASAVLIHSHLLAG
jgi:hypothetical protein